VNGGDEGEGTWLMGFVYIPLAVALSEVRHCRKVQGKNYHYFWEQMFEVPFAWGSRKRLRMVREVLRSPGKGQGTGQVLESLFSLRL
jgi:hypothetical protein